MYRANSTQSLRIRTLEGEVSRLLAENVSLREQIIHLHYEVESYANARQEQQREQIDTGAIDALRENLEAKLREVGDLLSSGLGQIRQDAVRVSACQAKVARQKRRSTGTATTALKRSPDQRQWKNTLTLSDVANGGEADDGRLPVILEDKYYPRETLEYVRPSTMPSIFAGLLHQGSCTAEIIGANV